MLRRLALLCAVSCSGCIEMALFDALDGDDDSRVSRSAPGGRVPSPSTPPAGCHVDPATWARAVALYDATEGSFHEVVTCGQLQVQLARSVVAIVLASNREMFRAQDFETLARSAQAFGLRLDVPFAPVRKSCERTRRSFRERDSCGLTGRWTMTVGEGAVFTLDVFAPDGGGPITEDPFRLDSYVHVVRTDSSLSLDEMIANTDSKTVVRLKWDERGPLYHLLAAQGDLPNPIVVEFSLSDVLALVQGDEAPPWREPPRWGPFPSLIRAEIASTLELSDLQDGADVAAVVSARRATMDDIAATGRLAFDVDHVEAHDGMLSLTTTRSDLSLVQARVLAGTIEHEIATEDTTMRVVEDFGSGAAYPTPRWSCR